MTKREGLLIGLCAVLGSCLALTLYSTSRPSVNEQRETAAVSSDSSSSEISSECSTDIAKFRALLLENTDGNAAKKEIKQFPDATIDSMKRVAEEKGPSTLTADRQFLINSMVSRLKTDRKFTEELIDGLIKTSYAHQAGEVAKACQ